MINGMEEAESLFEKYRRGECTEQELALLRSWFHELHGTDDSSLDEMDLCEAGVDFENKVRYMSRVKMHWKKTASVAASLLLIGVAAAYFFYRQEAPSEKEYVTLTLDDGRVINLSEVHTGQLIEGLGISVQKTDSGTIQYRFDAASEAINDKVAYHTVQTPIGDNYELVLEDGTKVFLNARSSVQFPTTFKGLEERLITVDGEAYFEVAKAYQDSAKKISKPFLVRSTGQTVEVLGTAFNIHAYKDEPFVKTTLGHGVVRVYSEKDRSYVLLDSPGQQAIAARDKIRKVNANTADEFAWRRGKILLQDQDIYSIMRIIGRFYPIKVVFEDDFAGELFGGVLSKDKRLEEVLKLIEETGEVRFRVEAERKGFKERRVTVMK